MRSLTTPPSHPNPLASDAALLIAIALAAAVVVAGVWFGAKAAGGSDSYGYVSQAELWSSGRLQISQPWVRRVPWPGAEYTFAPLGYRHGTDPTLLVPTYSPGLPMLMALAERLAGACALFWVVPLSGGLLVLSTFGIGRRLGASTEGVIAAWLMATSPVFLYALMWPMSDVPVAAAWAAVFWCVLGASARSVVSAGLIAAVAVLIRPNLVVLVSLPPLWLTFEAWRAPTTDERRRHIRNALLFVTCAAPGIAVTAALNNLWYGSPWRSGYGALTDLFAWANVWPNAGNYGAWLAETQTPLVFLGFIGLLAPARWLWPHARRRSAVVVLGLAVFIVWAEYCAYEVFGAWWYLRFLLPSWPFLMLGLAAVLWWPARLGRRASLLAAAVVVVLGVRDFRLARERFAFETQASENKYIAVANVVKLSTEPNAVIFSGLHSGSLRYYAGRTTLVYFQLAPAWLDRAVAWLADNDAHPYALLEGWEVQEFKHRFGSTNAMGQLAMAPMVAYRGGGNIYLFDLLRPAGPDQRMREFIDTAAPHCVPPAPPPRLVLPASPAR